MSARIEAHNESGYGRLVLTFELLPKYRHEVASGVLMLAFEEPVDVDVSRLVDAFGDYVVVARRDPDGRALRLALSRSFRVNLMEAGNQLYIDLLPPDWKGLPPGLPIDVVRELARRAAEAEERARIEARQRREAGKTYTVQVRLARQPTFSRIVFDWNDFVTAEMSREGATVRLAFGQTAAIDLSRLNVEPPPALRSAEAHEREQGLLVILKLEDDVDVRGFREGNAFVVDLTPPQAAIDSRLQQALTADSAATAPRSATAPGIDLPAEQKPAEAEEEEEAAAPAEAAGRLESGDGEEERGATNTADMAASEAPAAAPPAATEPQTQSARAASAAHNGAASGGEAAASQHAGVAEGERALSAATAEIAIGDAVRLEGKGDSVRIIFPFAHAVDAAIFRRGRTLWVVFDGEARFDISDLAQGDNSVITDAAYARVDGVDIYRIGLSHPWLVYAEARSNAWIVSVGNMVTGSGQPLALTRELRDDRRSVVKVKLERAGRVHWLKDPIYGDRLAIVTAGAPTRHVSKQQDFVDFEALATAQGLAVRPKSDDLALRLLFDEVTITRPPGLFLSAGNAGQYAAGRKPLEQTGRPGFLDFKAWRIDDPAKLSDRLHALLEKVALGGEEQRTRLRYELARLYLANGLTAESLGIARAMAADDPGVENDPAFNAMRGAALVLMHRPAQARKDLAVHALANDQHAALWRALMHAQEKDWEQTLRAMDDGAEAIGAYPEDLQARFRLAAARAALALERLSRAAAELQALPRRGLPEELRMEALLVEGRYLEAVGRRQEALESYTAVLKGGNQAARAEAELNTIATRLAGGEMSQDEAIVALERLQLFWRGDDIELRTLRLLADLYAKQQRYRDAFDLMKKALIAFPDAPLALQIQDDMRLVFEDLFLRGKADALRPVEAVSLYYAHREMTPPGRLGDEMIRKLADRLISVDLLDQAAELLDHQVEKRLSGAARAQVATRLAMVHLMNHKPELALRAIRQTRQAGLATTLLHGRNLLEARALSELGRWEAALEILSTMEGDEVEELRAEALWLGQQWRRAGEQMEKMLATSWQEPRPLTDHERFQVLRAGICYALAEDQFSLDRLRQKFHDKMLRTKDAEAFALVTRPVRSDAVALRQLAKDVAAVDTLEAFMKEYRRRYDRAEPEAASSGEAGSGAG